MAVAFENCDVIISEEHAEHINERHIRSDIKSNSPEGPSEFEKMWHKVGKTDPLIFRPEITYSMLRIVV